MGFPLWVLVRRRRSKEKRAYLANLPLRSAFVNKAVRLPLLVLYHVPGLER